MNPNISLDTNNLLRYGSDALIYVSASDMLSTDMSNQLQLGGDSKLSTKPNAYGASFSASAWVINPDGFYELHIPDSVHQLGAGIKIVEVINDNGDSVRDGFFQVAFGFAVRFVPITGEVILFTSAPFDGELLITSFYY